MSSKVAKRSPSVPSKKSKVRAVPDFSKLHGQWQKKLQKGIACKKKPCTVVQEFGLSKTGTRVESAKVRALNRDDDDDDDAYGDENVQPFSLDAASLESIIHKEGLAERNLTGRATMAGMSVLKNRTNLEPRQSDQGIKAKVMDNKSIQGKIVKSGGRSVKRKATSPPNAETMQTNKEVKFETDRNALQSILDNRGIREGNGPTPETFNTKPKATHQSGSRPEARPSIYSRVPVDPNTPTDPAALFSNYKSRILSRLRPEQAAGSPQTAPRDAFKLNFEPIRNSMYVRRVRPCGTASESVRKSMLHRAKRVPTTPGNFHGKSPGAPKTPVSRGASQKKFEKWKDILSQPKDQVKKSLNFEDDNEAEDGAEKIKLVDKKEQLLASEIRDLSLHNGGHKPRKSADQREVETRSGVVLDEQQLKYIEEEEAKLKAEIAAMEHKKAQESAEAQSRPDDTAVSEPQGVAVQTRQPFAQLSVAEIRQRSLFNDSDCEASPTPSPSSPRPSSIDDEFPVSPLAKDATCTPVSPFAVTHTIKSKIKSDASKIIRERDIWSPRQQQQRQRMAGCRRRSKSRSPRQQRLKKDGVRSPLFSHVMGRGLPRAESDKENQTPEEPLKKRIPSIEVYQTTATDDMVSANAVAVDTVTIDTVAVEYAELEAEAAALSESFVDPDMSLQDTDEIYVQITAVRERQQKLLEVEKKLRAKLEARRHKRDNKQDQENRQIQKGQAQPKVRSDQDSSRSAKKRLDLAVSEKQDGLTEVFHTSDMLPSTDEKIQEMTECTADIPTCPVTPVRPPSDNAMLSPLRAAALAMTSLSPRPVVSVSPRRVTMSGSAQLCGRPDPPILTPMALRNLAVSPGPYSHSPGPCKRSPGPHSPIDLSIVRRPSDSVPMTPPPPLRTRLQEHNAYLTKSPLLPTSSPVVMTTPARLARLRSPRGHKTLLPSLVSATAQRYHDALLDDEVSLYMCRLNGDNGLGSLDNTRCHNPLARIFDEGDDMHFIPVSGHTSPVLRSPPSAGSAFFSYRFI